MWKNTKIFPKQKYFLPLFETLKKMSSKFDVAQLDKPSRYIIFLLDFFVFEFFQRLARNNFFIKFSFHDLNQPYWPGKSFFSNTYITF